MALQQREAKIETTTDSRRRRRHKLFLEVEARGPKPLAGMVIVHDISDTGLLIETKAKLKAGEMVEVDLPHAGVMEAEIMWAGGQIYGCRFTRQITPAAISAARLGSPFARPTPDTLETVSVDAPQMGAQTITALTGELSPGARLWIIIGLALSLWMIIGAATYWMVA
ncbi:MAG: PilZ domain-containing protein [Pseudomonadota bacterium]